MSKAINGNRRIFVRIRKEQFGYIFFERFTREHYFVKEDRAIESFSHDRIEKFLKQYFGNGKKIEYEFIPARECPLELSAPIGMYLEISKKCNLSCKHCYKTKEEAKQEIGIDSTKNLIDRTGISIPSPRHNKLARRARITASQRQKSQQDNIEI